MRFHARLDPGVVTDPEQVVQLVIHTPARCADVTIKLWELDVFRDPETGERRDEGTQDDLLAEFTGSIEPGDADRGSPDWRRFVVASHRIVSDDPDLARFRLRLPGNEGTFDVPIVSEAGEVEGTAFELGLSIEHAGEERYRTTVPCLFAPPRVNPTVIDRRVEGYTEDYAPAEGWTADQRLSNRYVAFGVARGDPGPRGVGQTLEVLLRAFVDAHGRLVQRAEDVAAGAAARPLSLRAGRKLYAYLHDAPDAVELGPTRIPIAVCDALGDAGQVVHERPAMKTLGTALSLDDLLRLAGEPVERAATSASPRRLAVPGDLIARLRAQTIRGGREDRP